jgi:outer membrane protein OmpA-like peptidoglycan-associated protein
MVNALPRFLLVLSVLAVSQPWPAVSFAQSGDASTTAAAPTPAQLIEALKSKGTRGFGAPQSSAEAQRLAEQDKVIQRLKEKATRGLSVGEREELAEAISDRPAFDLEVTFDLNSATISERARPVVMALGSALENSALQGSAFLVAGHTDATGPRPYNQELSQRRAQSVKEFLLKNFNLREDNLVVVGYGQEQLKNPRAPSAGENRRVQVVNISPATTTAEKQ